MAQLTYKGTHHLDDEPTLDLQGVGASYSESVVLENITFRAEVGEQIAVIGPNGAGKSTLLKVVAGVVRPDSGSVKMFGFAPDKHICIAYVPQRSEIDWTFPVTVADVVMMGRTKLVGLFRRPSRHDHDTVRSSLERVQADHLADKQIGELSGGQQQRVFIARALAMETNLLLMDEPFGGLDVPSQQAILDILDGLRNEGVTVLLATHDLGMAAERFDRVMLLNRRIVALGEPKNVLTSENLLIAYGGGV